MLGTAVDYSCLSASILKKKGEAKMRKTVLVHSTDTPLAGYLRQRGYQVKSFHDAHQPGRATAAVLLTAYRPSTSIFDPWDCADITVGSYHDPHCLEPIQLNVTGIGPEKTASVLDHCISHEKL